FVVIPSYHLPHIIDPRRQFCFTSLIQTISPNDSLQYQLVCITQNTFDLSFRSISHSSVDFFNSYFFANMTSNVCQRTIGNRNPDSTPPNFVLQRRENLRQSFGSSCCRWHNRLCCTTSSAQVFMRLVM